MKQLIYLFTLLITTSCALSVRTPSSRMLSPEANGQGGIGVNAALAESTEATVSLSGNNTNNPLALKKDSVLNWINPSLGITDRLDFYANIVSNSPSTIGAKFQFWGDNTKNAKAGNVSLSIAVAAGSSEKEVDDDFFDITGNTKTDLKTDVSEVSIIMGYRADEWILFFVEAILSEYGMEGKIRSDNTSLDGKNFKYTGKVNSFGAGFYIHRSSAFARFALTYQKADWSLTQDDSFTLGSVAIGVNF